VPLLTCVERTVLIFSLMSRPCNCCSGWGSTGESGWRTDYLPEGTYYYTFLLRKVVVFGLWEACTLVRFSETIPTAKIGIGRIKDQMELRELAHRRDVAGYEYEAKLNEAEIRLLESRRMLARAKGTTEKLPAGDPVVAEQIAAADALVEMYLASETSIEHLKQNPKFQKLAANKQQEVVEWMKERLDVGELSARQEMRKP
jgi:hypothetical protein